MGNAIVTFKIMPESPDVDLEPIKEQALAIGKERGAKGNMDSKIEPVAFGLQQILILGMFEVSDDMDFDDIAVQMGKIEGVASSEVAKMDLALG